MGGGGLTQTKFSPSKGNFNRNLGETGNFYKKLNISPKTDFFSPKGEGEVMYLLRMMKSEDVVLAEDDSGTCS